MAITLYWGSGSVYAWRVQLALELKGLTYESRLLSFSNKETRTPEFLAINPRGKIPVLVDGELTVRESHAILHYLDRAYPEPSIFGRTPAATAAIMQAVCEVQSYLENPVLSLTRTVFQGEAAAQAAELSRHAETLRSELQIVEDALAGEDWLAGRSPSAADIQLFPLLQILARALGKPDAAEFDLGLAPLAQRYPNVGRWMERIEALPGYSRTYPPHWRT